MNAIHDEMTQSIVAQLVSEADRLNTLPRHFGRYLGVVENLVYDFARRLVPSYSGAYWDFFELSNEGFYMRPSLDAAEVIVNSNGFSGELSADAIGITVCLFAFSHGSFTWTGETFALHYHLLREFSYLHPEAALICAATD